MFDPVLSGIFAASMQRAKEEREVYRWLGGERQEPLTTELKSRFVCMVDEEFGVYAAAKAMDQVATNYMPQVIQ